MEARGQPAIVFLQELSTHTHTPASPPAIPTTQDRIFSWPGTLQVDQAVQDLPCLPPWHHDYKCLPPFPVFVSSMGSRTSSLPTELSPQPWGRVNHTQKKSLSQECAHLHLWDIAWWPSHCLRAVVLFLLFNSVYSLYTLMGLTRAFLRQALMYVRLAYNSVAKNGLGHMILLHPPSARIAGVCRHMNYVVLGIEPKTSGMLGNHSTNRATSPASNDNFV